MYYKLVTAVRLIFGIQMTLSGLNWWVKISRYPSIADFANAPPPDDILGALVDTGFMFDFVKAIELLAGLALLLNLYVPLMLVVVFAVTVPVFMVDVFISSHLRAFLMGAGAFVQNVFLLFAYFSRYKPMLGARTKPDAV